MGEAVSNSGIVVGNFPDPAYPLPFYGKNLNNGGIWENGVWTSLGLGLVNITLVGQSDAYGTTPVVVSADGTKILGGSNIENGNVNPVPFAWNKNNEGGWDTQTYAYPTGANATVITGMSADGTLACGYYSHINNIGQSRALIWTSPEEYIEISDKPNTFGQALGMSPNGRYVSLTLDSRAAIYDTETEEIKYIAPLGIRTYAKDVSDNGIAVVYNFDTYLGYIWAEELGLIDLVEYLDTFANLELPNESTLGQGVYMPSFISADGTIFGGWEGLSYDYRNAWIVKTGNIIPQLPARPSNLSYTV